MHGQANIKTASRSSGQALRTTSSCRWVPEFRERYTASVCRVEDTLGSCLIWSFLDAIANLLKATISFVMFVCPSARPSVRMEQIGSHQMYFHEIWFLRNFGKSVKKIIKYCSWFDVFWSFGVVGLEWYPCCRLKPATRIPLQPNHAESPTHFEPRTIRPMW